MWARTWEWASLAIYVSDELSVTAALCVHLPSYSGPGRGWARVCAEANRLQVRLGTGLGAGVGVRVLQCCLQAQQRWGAALDAQTTLRAHLGTWAECVAGDSGGSAPSVHTPARPALRGSLSQLGTGKRLDSLPVALTWAPWQQQQRL